MLWQRPAHAMGPQVGNGVWLLIELILRFLTRKVCPQLRAPFSILICSTSVGQKRDGLSSAHA